MLLREYDPSLINETDSILATTDFEWMPQGHIFGNRLRSADVVTEEELLRSEAGRRLVHNRRVLDRGDTLERAGTKEHRRNWFRCVCLRVLTSRFTCY